MQSVAPPWHRRTTLSCTPCGKRSAPGCLGCQRARARSAPARPPARSSHPRIPPPPAHVRQQQQQRRRRHACAARSAAEQVTELQELGHMRQQQQQRRRRRACAARSKTATSVQAKQASILPARWQWAPTAAPGPTAVICLHRRLPSALRLRMQDTINPRFSVRLCCILQGVSVKASAAFHRRVRARAPGMRCAAARLAGRAAASFSASSADSCTAP